MSTQTARCDGCGIVEDLHLLDGKPSTGNADDDFDILECIRCYGPGWMPVGGPEDFARSVAPELKPHYDKWKAAQEARS